MPHAKRKIQWGKYRFLLLLVLLITAGALCSIYGPEHWGHPAEAIGDALIIAGVLGLTVDGYVKSHLLEEASRDILKYMFGYHLNEELKGTMMNLMFTERVSRDLHLHYKLALQKDRPDKLSVELTLTYRVENLTYIKYPYSQYFYQDAQFLPRFLELRCDSSDNDANYNLGEEELLEQVKKQKEAFVIKVEGPAVSIPPRNYEGQSKHQFTIKCASVYPQDDSDVFVFDYPTVGVVITAEYPDDLEFEGPGKPAAPNRWEYPRVFLGGEQVTVYWRKKPPIRQNSPNGIAAQGAVKQPVAS
jgi:hypothetical protein